MAFFINFSMLFLSTFLLLMTFSIDHSAATISFQSNNITLTGFTKLSLPPNVGAVGSLSFDLFQRGPFVGTTDGRILFFSRLLNSWNDYAFTSPIRNKALCDGTIGFDRAATCGFTTGLGFSPFSQDLYACDPYFGLTFVGILGGAAITVVRNTDAVPPLRFANSVDAATDGMVYFTDTSSVYGPKDAQKSRETKDSTGRLLQYNPITKKLTTLLSQLAGPVGVATNTDASFVLVSESNGNRILRYWLRGEKAGTSEVFLTFEADPNKIKRNQEGNFWVGVNTKRNDSSPAPQGVKFSPSGEILAAVDLSQEYPRRITAVAQRGEELFVNAVNITFIGRYRLVYN